MVHLCLSLQTFVVGEVDDDSKKLVKVAHDCLQKAVAMCKPGVRYRDVGDAISRHAQANGCVTAWERLCSKLAPSNIACVLLLLSQQQRGTNERTWAHLLQVCCGAHILWPWDRPAVSLRS
jgi:methionine aminopeptidase